MLSIQIISPLVSQGGGKKKNPYHSACSLCSAFGRGGRGRFQALPQTSPQKTFLAGLARAAGRGRRRRAPGVPLSRAAAPTSRRACLFKFQLRGRETAPPGAQAGRRRLARCLKKMPKPLSIFLPNLFQKHSRIKPVTAISVVTYTLHQVI